MEESKVIAAHCYFTRVDLSDALGERLLRLQKRREKKRESKGESVSEWWNEGDSQLTGKDEVSSQEEEEAQEFVLSPAEQELAAQMAAMGLPTVLGGGIKNQARTSATKTRRKAKKCARSTALPANPSAEPATPLQTSQSVPLTDLLTTPTDTSPWQPVWDSEYGAFYWCNTETLESQWEVPDGLEAHAAALYAFGIEERTDVVESSGGGGEEPGRVGLLSANDAGGGAFVNGGVCAVSDRNGHPNVEAKRTERPSLGKDAARLSNGDSHLEAGGGGKEAKGRAGNAGLTESEGRSERGGTGRLSGIDAGVKSSFDQGVRFEGGTEAAGRETRPDVKGFELRGRPRPCGTHIRFGDESGASDSGSESGALESIGGGARVVSPSEGNGEALDLMEVDDPMDVDSYGGVETRGRSWGGKSERDDAPVVGFGSEEKVRGLGKSGLLDNGASSVPVVGRDPDARKVGNAAECTPVQGRSADVSVAVRDNVTAVRKADAVLRGGMTDVRTKGLRVLKDNEAVRNGEVEAAAAGRGATVALEGGAITREETDGAVLDEKRAAVLGDRLLEAARERAHEGPERSAQSVAESERSYGTRARATVDGGATPRAEAAVKAEAIRQLDAEYPDAPAFLAVRNSLSNELKAAEVDKLSSRPTPPLTSREPLIDAKREGCPNLLTSVPEPKASAGPEPAGGRGGIPMLTSAPVAEASDVMNSEAERSRVLTSALAPEADAGAGGDAGGAVLVASVGGREKPADVGQKYWFQRYRLFSKFDQGVRLDPEGWYSVTPEAIAVHHAKRCARPVVIDAFAGVGGNAIQMATTADWVIAVDLDPGRLALAEHNAGVYGVRDNIEFVAGDFLRLAPRLRADALFLSPPWGGPEYSLVETYDLDSMLEPVSGVELFKAALQVTSNIALFLPRNVDVKQLQELAWLASPPLPCEIESNYLCGKLKCITAYYGDLVVPQG